MLRALMSYIRNPADVAGRLLLYLVLGIFVGLACLHANIGKFCGKHITLAHADTTRLQLCRWLCTYACPLGNCHIAHNFPFLRYAVKATSDDEVVLLQMDTAL